MKNGRNLNKKPVKINILAGFLFRFLRFFIPDRNFTPNTPLKILLSYKFKQKKKVPVYIKKKKRTVHSRSDFYLIQNRLKNNSKIQHSYYTNTNSRSATIIEIRFCL